MVPQRTPGPRLARKGHDHDPALAYVGPVRETEPPKTENAETLAWLVGAFSFSFARDRPHLREYLSAVADEALFEEGDDPRVRAQYDHGHGHGA